MDLITWATTSDIEAEPTMTLYLCLRSIPAWIHAFKTEQWTEVLSQDTKL